MKLEAAKFGVATAVAFALIWIVCSALVALMPTAMMGASGNMTHGDFSGMSWSLHLGGFIVGGILWTLFAGVTAWLIAAIYNKLIG